MVAEKLSRSSYLSRNVGDYQDIVEIMGVTYAKVDNLRYGTNPHQTAAVYKPIDREALIADLEVLKTGKSGLSQTNWV